MADQFSAGGLRDSLRDAGTAVAHAVRFLDIAAAEQAELRARITALQAQLAEARRKAIEECIALVAPSDSDVACAEREADDDGFWSIHVQCREECEQHLRALLTKPAQGEGAK